MDDKQNPGSKEAVLLGCTCPVMDNNYGRGFEIQGETCFYFSLDCPIHGTKTHENELE